MNDMTFERYLRLQGLSPSTIDTYGHYRDIFTNWVEESGQRAEELTYADILGYVGHCRERGLKQDYIAKLMGVVRHYYNFLKHTGRIRDNPAAGLHVRGRGKRIPHDLLTTEQLEEMYTTFDQKGLAGKRNKVMLGLMVFQGLTTRELELLEPAYLMLKEGRLKVPGSRRSNGRTLELKAHQMIEMQEYVSRTRMLILELTGKESDKLFVSTGRSNALHGSLDKLLRHLRGKHEHFSNARQLRQSRIAIWIRHHDIRRVQYMAGHRYVSSTEHYRSTDMEDLRGELEEHHPSK